MAVTLLSSTVEAFVGQLVRFTAQTNFNPPVWDGNHGGAGYEGSILRAQRAVTYGGSDWDDELYQLTNITQEPHKVRFAAKLGPGGGFFDYTFHATNQFSDGSGGPVGDIGTKEIAVEFYLVANPAIIPLQVRSRINWDLGTYELQIFDHSGLKATYQNPLGILAGTKITLSVTPPFIQVRLNNSTVLYTAGMPGAYPLPWGLQYSARGIADNATIAWGSGHPATLIPGTQPAPIVFNEAVLAGDWRDQFYFGDVTSEGALLRVDVLNNVGTILGFASIINQGYDAAGHYFFECLVPNTATATQLRGVFAAHGPLVLNPNVWTGLKLVDIVAGADVPLTISGPNPVSIEPGATYRFVSPEYTTPELTFDANGDGSFGTGADANLYTAPTDAGQYLVTVSKGAQSVDIVVNVPVRLVPVTASLVGGTTQGFTVNADVTTPGTDWTTTGGTLSAQATRTCTYEAPTNTGNYEIRVTTVEGQTSAPIAVTSSGSIPTAGLRLNFDQVAGTLNGTLAVRMRGDVSPAIWAILNNARIDGSNNNLFILQNSAAMAATIAQAHRSAGAILTWLFNSTLALSPSDSCTFGWQILDANQLVVASLIFEYLGSGQAFDLRLTVGGGEAESQIVTMTATGGIQIESTDQTHITFRYREDSGSGWIVIGSDPRTVPSARFFRFVYEPTITSRANNSVIIGPPTLTGVWGRWLPPTWSAELINSQNQVIGTVPFTPFESTTIISGQLEQGANIFLTTVGTVRVRASYPSGARTVNETIITVAPPSGPALAVTSPTSPKVCDPGEQVAVTVNVDVGEVSFQAGGGAGSFGSTVPTRHIYTAPQQAGNYFFTVTRGTEVVRIDVIVRAKASEAAFQVVALGNHTFTVNYVGSFSAGATAGTVGFGVPSGGATPLTYTAPVTPGNYTINISTPFGNVAVAVTVTAVSLPPLEITTAPQTLEPGATLLIETTYPAAEVVFQVPFPGNISNAGLFTAPATAGKYTITAFRANAGNDTVEITVPLRITPRVPPARAPGQALQFTFNYPTLTELRLSNGAGTITAGGLWTPGTTPGAFTLFARAVIGGVNFDDTINLQVVVAALNLNQPAAVTLNPGEQLAITSPNYTTAQLTFDADRGTFVDNVYTAPADAGPDTITVTKDALTAQIAVTVRLTITPAATTIATATNQLFTVNADVTLFSGAGLSLSSITTRTVQAQAAAAGTYFLQANTALGNIVATLTVTGAGPPALAIQNADPTQLESGGQLDVLTNYPTAEVTFSATGGSFHATIKNRYTAPDTAGSYTITATRGAQNDTLVINVPYRVSPAAIIATPGTTVQFRANHPSTSWDEVGAVGIISVTGLLAVGFTPGNYPNSIVATAPGSLSATASVTVEATQFQVYSPSHITLEPSSPYVVATNIPPQSVQFTAFGGSFDNNTYIAPQQSGDYYFTVSYQGQTIRVDVHVPLRITPNSKQLAANETFQFIANAAGVNWSLSGTGNLGTISQTGFYTAPATGGSVVTVRASTLSASDTATVFFLTLWDYQPNYPVEGEVDRVAVVVASESGRQSSRVRAGVLRSFVLSFLNREKDEYLAARAFFEAHYPTAGFIFEDIEAGDFVAVQFVEKMAARYNSAQCQFDYQWSVKEIEE